MYLSTCPRCSQSNPHDQHFCGNCGQDLTVPTVPDLGALSAQGFVYKGTVLAAYNGKDAHVAVPNGTTAIGPHAFERNNTIRSVVLPDSLTAIENNAFFCCMHLTEVQWGRGLTRIGDNAFADTGLTAIDLPDSVVSLGRKAFSGCRNATTIRPGRCLRDLGHGAFDWCTANTAFAVAPGNTAFAVRDGVLFDSTGRTLLYYPAANPRKAYTVPHGVHSIAYAAFMGAALAAVTLPMGLEQIGDCAFLASGLEAISLPSTVKTVRSGAFYNCTRLCSANLAMAGGFIDNLFAGCPGLTTIAVAAANLGYCVRDGVLYTKDGSVLLTFPAGDARTAFTVPAGVRTIADRAFHSCAHLGGITIPDGVCSIGRESFYGCGLRHLVLPRGTTSVGILFNYGTATPLQWVYIPNTLTTITSTLCYDPKVAFYCQAPAQPVGWGKDWCKSPPSLIHWGVAHPPRE